MAKRISPKPTIVKYNGAGFNADWAASVSEQDFISHEKGSGFTDAQLKEVHGLCKKAVGVPAKPRKEPDAEK
jgi:hypothetical protein